MKRLAEVEFTCLYCGAKDRVKRSQYRHYKGAGRFCSRRCHFAYYRKHPEARSSYVARSLDSMGYWTVPDPEHPGRRIREHRVLMIRHIGRYLMRQEHVHHRNGIKTDNRLENLELVTESDHHKMHAVRFEELDEVKRLHAEGLGRRRIAKVLGCADATVHRAIKMLGLAPHPPGSRGSRSDRRARVIVGGV